MSQNSNQRAYFPLLDLYRAVAAGLVVLEHARHYLFVDFVDIKRPDVVSKGFYFLTQFGHEAVLLFFVLSGLVVGRIVVDQVSDGTWSWRSYLYARLTRLWIVLIPAVVLTGILDFTALGVTSGSHFVHQGNFAHIQHHPLVNSLGLGTFVGNIFFLQTILVPPFGSNGPLWSLAYEFWYYILFAGIWVAAFTRSTSRARIAGFLIAIACLCVVSRDILVLSGIWLSGVAAYLLWRKFPIHGRRAIMVLGISLLGTVLTMVALRLDYFDKLRMPVWVGQYALGLSFTFCVWASLEIKDDSLLMRAGGFFSKFSYSLYLVHLPVLSLLAAPFISNNSQRMQPGVKSYAIYGAVLAALYFSGYLFFRLTENNTGKLRRWVSGAGRG